jgi:hypothetical protein
MQPELIYIKSIDFVQSLTTSWAGLLDEQIVPDSY